MSTISFAASAKTMMKLSLSILMLLFQTTAPIRAQGFCHGCSRQRAVATTPAGVAAQAAADASTEAYTQACANQRAQLVSELELLSGRCERLGSALAKTPALRQAYNTALAAWGALRTTCPTIGAPPAGARPSAAAATPESLGSSHIPTSATQYALVSALSAHGITGAPSGSTLGVVPLVIADRAAQSVDSALQRVDSVKPAAAPSDPAPAAPQAVPVPAGATAADTAGLAYANALRKERAYLGGFLASYAVYLAARDSKNLVGMLSAAATMGVSVDSALMNAHTAAERRHAYLQLIARALGQADSSLRTRRTNKSPAAIATTETPAADSGKALAPEAQATVAAAGVPADDVTVARSAAQGVTPAQLTQAASNLRSEVRATDSVRVALTARDSAAAWPEPPDLPRLLHARGLAMQSRVQAARALDDSIASVHSSAAGQAGVPAAPSTEGATTRNRATTWIAFVIALLLGAAAGYGIRAARDPHLRSA